MEPVIIDLAANLHKIRQAYNEGKLQAQDPNIKHKPMAPCSYRSDSPTQSPCAIGVLLTDEQAHAFDALDSSSISTLMEYNHVRPVGLLGNGHLHELQILHDAWNADEPDAEANFVAYLDDLERLRDTDCTKQAKE